MTAVAAALLLPSVLGYLILALQLRADRETGLLERVCLSFPLGMGLVTMQMFVLGLLRVPCTLRFTAVPVAAEVAVLALWLAKERISPWPGAGWGPPARESPARRAFAALLAVWAVAKIASIWVETGARPLWAWDTWFNWSAGAKVFFHAQSLLLDAPPADFFGRGAVSRFLGYPLHNTLMQVWLAQWAGTFDEVLVKFTTPLLLTSSALYLYALAARETSRLAGLALLVLFLASPLMSYHSVEVYSDLPLGVYLMLASAALLNGMRGRRAYWPLVGVFSAQALFTKEEALFFVVPLLLSCAGHLRGAFGPPRERLARLGATLSPLLLVLPWYLFKHYHGLGLGPHTGRFELTFHPEVVKLAAEAVLSLANFNVLFVFLPGLLLAGGKPSRELLHLLVPVVSYALFFLSLFAFTAAYQKDFHLGLALFRNMLTCYPSAALLVVLLLKGTAAQAQRPWYGPG